MPQTGWPWTLVSFAIFQRRQHVEQVLTGAVCSGDDEEDGHVAPGTQGVKPELVLVASCRRLVAMDLELEQWFSSRFWNAIVASGDGSGVEMVFFDEVAHDLVGKPANVLVTKNFLLFSCVLAEILGLFGRNYGNVSCLGILSGYRTCFRTLSWSTSLLIFNICHCNTFS